MKKKSRNIEKDQKVIAELILLQEMRNRINRDIYNLLKGCKPAKKKAYLEFVRRGSFPVVGRR